MNTVYWLILVSSLALGSFSNNIISFFIGTSAFDLTRSTCFCGKQKLKIREIIPLFSFIVQRAKCNYCKEKIPIRFLAVEFIVLLAGIVTYIKFGLSLEFIFNFLIIVVLILIGIIDFISLRIPNQLLISLFLLMSLKYFFIPGNFVLINLILSVVLTSLLLVSNFISKKELIGMGDIKLIPLLLLMIGFPVNLFALWLSATLGVMVYYTFNLFKNNKIPFGTFLSLSFIISSLLEHEINSLLVNIYGIS